MCKYLPTPDPVPDEVAALVEASIAESTRGACRSDLAQFSAWGGRMPGEPALVPSYLAAHAETLSVATLVRHIATISKAHEARGMMAALSFLIFFVDLKSMSPTELVDFVEKKLRISRGLVDKFAD